MGEKMVSAILMVGCNDERELVNHRLKIIPFYSFSNPWLVNFNVRLFSVTVRTT